MRYVVYGLLLLLYLLHTDVWYWNDAGVALGLPIGVTYHLLWTLLVSGAFWLAVRYAWPPEIEHGGDLLSPAAGGGHGAAAGTRIERGGDVSRDDAGMAP